MTILVTRPEGDAAELKARLEAMGHDVLLAPLLSIAPEPIPAAAIADAAALIMTSRNAAAALAASNAAVIARHLPIFAVGRATAAKARALGFAHVIEGPGAAAGLSATIATHLRPGAGVLVHLAGEHLAHDLAGDLRAMGYDVKTQRAYRAVASTSLPAVVAGRLAEGGIAAVVLLSPRTASVWLNLAARQGFDLTRIKHLCLSPKVADALPAALRATAKIAGHPDIENLLTLL